MTNLTVVSGQLTVVKLRGLSLGDCPLSTVNCPLSTVHTRGFQRELRAGIEQHVPEELGRVAAEVQLEAICKTSEQRVDSEDRPLTAAADGQRSVAEINGCHLVQNPLGV